MMKIIGTDIRQRLSDFVSSGKRTGKDDEVNAGTAGSSNRSDVIKEKAQAPSLLSDSQSRTPDGPSQSTAHQSQPVQLFQPFNRASQSENLNLKPVSCKSPYSDSDNASPTKIFDRQNGHVPGANGLTPSVEKVTSSFMAAATGGALSVAAAGAYGCIAGNSVKIVGDPGLGFGFGGALTKAGSFGTGAFGMGFGPGTAMNLTILNSNAEGNSVSNKKHPLTEEDARTEVEEMANHLNADGTSLVEEEEEFVIIDGLRLDKK